MGDAALPQPATPLPGTAPGAPPQTGRPGAGAADDAPPSNGEPVRAPERTLSYDKVSTIVARALGLSRSELLQAWGPAVEAELPALLALRRRVLGSKLCWDDERYVKWRYRLGRRDAGRGDIWVLRGKEGILGTIGTEEVLLGWSGGELPALRVMDLMVAPEVGESGLSAWLNLSVSRTTPCALALGMNARSAGTVTRLFEPLPQRASYVHPIGTRRIAERLTTTLHLQAIVPLASRLIAAGFAIQRRLKRQAALRHFVVTPVAHFDATFEPLLASANQEPSVHPQRSLAFLNWRIATNPRVPCTAWAVRLRSDPSGAPLGYLAVRCGPVGAARPTMHLLDWRISMQPDAATREGLLRALVCTAVAEAVALGCEDVASTLSHPASEQALLHAGFLASQPQPHRRMGVVCSDAKLREAIAQGVAWLITEADHDVDVD